MNQVLPRLIAAFLMYFISTPLSHRLTLKQQCNDTCYVYVRLNDKLDFKMLCPQCQSNKGRTKMLRTSSLLASPGISRYSSTKKSIKCFYGFMYKTFCKTTFQSLQRANLVISAPKTTATSDDINT